MKTLIFTGLVIGSLTYLVAEHHDTLNHWIADLQPQAKAIVDDGAQSLESVLKPVHEVQQADSQEVIALMQDVESLKQQVSELQYSLAHHNSASDTGSKLETLVSEPEVPEEQSIEPKIKKSSQYGDAEIDQLIANLQAGGLSQDLAPEDKTLQPSTAAEMPLMPAQERSEALFKLAQRMEMKAAGF